jgi:hypothetical protein
MDVERTMEFILEQSARNQAMLAEVIAAQRATEQQNEIRDRRLDRVERMITRLSRLGVKSRSKINGRLDNHDEWFAKQKAIHEKIDQTLAEIGDKLNGLINYVDRLPRNPPQS